MQSGHSLKAICKKKRGTIWVRGVVHWISYGELQVSPNICEKNKIRKGWDTVDFFPHHTNIPFISSVNLSAMAEVDLTESLLQLNPQAPFAKIVETKFESLRQLSTLFQARLNKPGAPQRLERTEKHTRPTRVNTHAQPRVERINNEPAQIVSTHQTPALTIP